MFTLSRSRFLRFFKGLDNHVILRVLCSFILAVCMIFEKTRFLRGVVTPVRFVREKCVSGYSIESVVCCFCFKFTRLFFYFLNFVTLLWSSLYGRSPRGQPVCGVRIVNIAGTE